MIALPTKPQRMLKVYRANDVRATEKGSVVIEFALVFPIIIMLIGYTLRLTQIIQAHQIASVLSREVATEAFGRCTDLTLQQLICDSADAVCVDIENTSAITQACVENVRDKYQGLWNAVRPPSNPSDSPATIAVEVYRHDLGNIGASSACTEADNSNRFSTDPSVPPAGISNSSLCRRNRVARARVSFPIRPITAFINLSPELISREVEIIDETIL